MQGACALDDRFLLNVSPWLCSSIGPPRVLMRSVIGLIPTGASKLHYVPLTPASCCGWDGVSVNGSLQTIPTAGQPASPLTVGQACLF